MAVSLTTSGCGADLVAAFALQDAHNWAAFAAGPVLADSERSRVVRFSWPANGGDTYYFKRYGSRGLLRDLRWMTGRSRAANEARNLRHLAHCGFPAAQVVVSGTRRVFGLARESFLITQAIPDSVDLATLLSGEVRANDPPRFDAATSDLARIVRALHGTGFFARDLRFRNILVRDAGATGAPIAFGLIDLPAGVMKAPDRFGTSTDAVADLATLGRDAALRLRRADGVRFLRAYFGIAPHGEKFPRAIHEIIVGPLRSAVGRALERHRRH